MQAFRFETGSADVWMQRESGCSLKGENLLASRNEKAPGGLTVKIDASLSGTYFITSSIGDNCEAGMRFALHILPGTDKMFR